MRLIYQIARDRKQQLAALLNSGCDIIHVEDAEHKVRFGFKYLNLATKAAEKANLDELRSIVLQLTGREMDISCVHDPNVTDWKARESAGRSALVRAAQEMGARVLSPESED